MEEFSSAWFDDASREWMKNKKRSPGIDGQYKYICTATKKNGEQCTKTVKANSQYCAIHGEKN
jgi:hypothetical protein